MKIRRFLWIVFGALISFTWLSYLPTIPPLSKRLHIQPNHQLETRFFVLFPGKYTLALAFAQTTPDSRFKLDQALGKFGCKQTDTKTPCGTFENYDFRWTIESSGRTLGGTASPRKVSGGWLSKTERATGLGFVDLSFGIHKLTFTPHYGLSSLNEFSPKLVLRPGHGAKSLQSDIALILSMAGAVCLYVLIPIFLVVSYIRYILTSRIPMGGVKRNPSGIRQNN